MYLAVVQDAYEVYDFKGLYILIIDFNRYLMFQLLSGFKQDIEYKQ